MPVAFDEAVKQMAKAGLDIDLYKRGPDGASVFSASIFKNQLKLFPGSSATFEIAADRKFKQAVLTVQEPTRSVTHTYWIDLWFNKGITEASKLNGYERSQVRELAEARFPVFIPGGKFKEPTILKWERNEAHAQLRNEERYHVQVSMTCTARKATHCFLVGRDEKAHFISLLPEVVDSVEAAHKVLRPKGLRSTAVRQGEWFFEPVSAAIGKKLDEVFFDARSSSREQTIRLGYNRNNVTAAARGGAATELEVGSSHHALIIRHEGQRYARGWVTDSRVDHHDPLWLEGWHKIVRNREKTVMPTAQMQNARFD